MVAKFRLVFCCCLIFVWGCTSKSNRERVITNESPELHLESVGYPDTCFVGVDTVASDKTVGCVGYFAKKISDEYVVQVQLVDTTIIYGNCEAISVDNTNDERFKLIVFTKGEAHLKNLCGDVVFVNAPKPRYELVARKGKIIAGYSHPTDYYGNERPKAIILIKHLEFIDSTTGRTITLENELFWKVLDVGMGG